MKLTKEQQRFNTTRAIFWTLVIAILGLSQMVILYLRSRTANPMYYNYLDGHPELGVYEDKAAAAQAKRFGIPGSDAVTVPDIQGHGITEKIGPKDPITP